MKLKIQARAKINWTLDVVGTLPNGYHDLDMLMQSVTLCDQMTMEEAPQLSLYVRAQGRAFVPADGNNLVLKAAAALQAATGCTRGARITLKKYIPVAAGMGGGSSDAAAALVGLNRLWGLGLSADRLEEIGLTVGADVPFCVRGGLQRAQGVGERLTPLAMKKPLYLVAFQPCRGLSTKEVFTALHEDGIRGEDRPDNEAAQRALSERGLSLGSVDQVESDKPEGTVVWQSIDANSSVNQGTTVNIQISKGKKADEQKPDSSTTGGNTGSSEDDTPGKLPPTPAEGSATIPVALPDSADTAHVVIYVDGVIQYDDTPSTSQGSIAVTVQSTAGDHEVTVSVDGSSTTQTYSFN